MSATYHYANLSKREWFDAASLGGNPKRSGLGYHLASRAFELLLIDGCQRSEIYDPVRPGRWAGDSILIVSDKNDRWLEYHDTFMCLNADVFLLLHASDGFDAIAEAADRYPQVFLQLAHLVVTHQVPGLEWHMKQRYGTNLYQRYQEALGTALAPPKNLGRVAGS
jgi:hypothetical protein